ncbi:MAG: STAS/SEC14 domain-containing protein [Candidatus Thorarchaeota archaeon]
MSYELRVKKENDFLNIHIKGKRDLESIKKATSEILKKCVENKCSRVLIDVREFKNRIGTMEIFMLASSELPKIIKGKLEQVAIIDQKGFEDKIKFFEDVARNRGYYVKIFTEYDEAINWIR